MSLPCMATSAGAISTALHTGRKSNTRIFFGLTANLNVFNLTDGRAVYRRTVYDGLRDNGVVQFHENRDLSV